MRFDEKYERRTLAHAPDLREVESVLKPFLGARALARLEPLSGGYSNTNLLMRTDAEKAPYVLRISDKPMATVQAEIAVMTLLEKELPVPQVLYADLSSPLEGRHLLVLEHMEGRLLADVEEEWSAEEAERFCRELGKAMAIIHAHRFDASGFLAPDLRISFKFAEFGSATVHHMLECLNRAAEKGRIGPSERDSIENFIQGSRALLDPIRRDCRLVHSDFNQKNILVRRSGDAWVLGAILDWEFAFSGSPLIDFGNLLRFEEETPKPYLPALTESYLASGGVLPADWRQLARFLDLINQLIFLSCEDERPKTFATALSVIRATMSRSQS